METLPRLVTSKDINFAEQPRLGLASLLLEAGYEDAELFVTALGEMFDTRSLFKLLEVFIIVSTPSICACAVMFSLLLGAENSEYLLDLMDLMAPKHTTGNVNMRLMVGAAQEDTYKYTLDWFDYTYYDYTQIIDDPYTFLEWARLADPRMEGVINAFSNVGVSDFIFEVFLLHTKLDLRRSGSKIAEIRRWINLSFVKYAFGASIDQSEWY